MINPLLLPESDFMPGANSNYFANLISLLRQGRLLRPLAVTYYLTTRCNLNCSYCEDFGARRNAQAMPPLPLADALRVLSVIRTATDSVYLTGGEPLLHPHIDELAARAHTDLGLKITLQTNASLLHEHEALLPHLSRLVVSLDTLDAEHWSGILNAPLHTAHKILENIHVYAAAQARFGYRMAVNCVITPATIPTARAILDFCKAENILVSFSPQAVQNWPNYDLLVSQEYKDFLQHLLAEKERGGPVLGSRAYLQTLFEFKPYACYPTLIPRVNPNGDLLYPCRPIEKEDNGHGGRPANLLAVRNWNEAIQRATLEYGLPPVLCTSCFQQCYAESSLLQAQPAAWLDEWLRYPASRQAHLFTYAPG